MSKESSPFAPRSNAPLPLAKDAFLQEYAPVLLQRKAAADRLERRLAGKNGSLADFACAHEYYGLHRKQDHWVFREYAPGAAAIWLVGDFSHWQKEEKFRLDPIGNGVWEGKFAPDAVGWNQHYVMLVKFPGGEGRRLPVYAREVVQNEESKEFTAYTGRGGRGYQFIHPTPPVPEAPLIYESHTGIAHEGFGVGSFNNFREKVLPMIAAKGYNTVQLMAVMEHPYYGSFGYHVANFFAVSSRFGTPDEFKALVDEAHRLGLRVIIDFVHSHCVKNEIESPAAIDGCRSTYFHAGSRGLHQAWDSLCFDYGKINVLHFLLSNCRFYLDEYHVDGFRFDGVTSMLYLDHGLNRTFAGYGDYFSANVDADALNYLTLANRLIHQLRPDAVTVAEDVSGMPGLASPEGVGFDYRMAMGATDMWFKLLDIPDEQWSIFYLYGELTNRRQDEKVIGYVECHDQAIVGGKSAMFQMADAAMYSAMHKRSANYAVDRAAALHKMMRLATAMAAGHGYLNFMGNEFGHPEWVDLPRAGNNWSYAHARRQWSLEQNESLRYGELGAFDRAVMEIAGGKHFYRSRVQTVRIDEANKVLIFERAGFWFVFNFHPTVSLTDYLFEALPGTYAMVLDSDAVEYGGFGMRKAGQRFFTLPRSSGTFVSCYLPARTALVLRRENQSFQTE